MSSEGSSTSPGKQSQREKQQEAFKKTCDKYVHDGLGSNPTIQFLLQRLVQMGCTPPKGFIRCMDCGDDVLAGGGFGVVEETIITTTSASTKQLKKEVEARAAKEQCQRSRDDLKAALQAEKDGKVKLRLLPEIFLCQQHLRDEHHAQEAIVHELIHAVDLCRFVTGCC